ncbi:MAG: carbohydrate kinase family protein [Candidatus Thorarchaeota archaeon]
MDYTHLIDSLKQSPSKSRAVILPDFFVDHYVLTEPLDELIANMKRIAEQGGGNVLGSEHIIRRGGNSVNTASALLTLGTNPYLIVKTDEQGAAILSSIVSPEMDLGLVHDDGAMSATVSIETEYKGRKVNIMISDSGSAATFSYSDLSEGDFSAIRSSSLIALLCLNHNRNAADLAHSLFNMVKTETEATTFMDTGDPSGNSGIVEPLTKRVLSEGLVDILGVNENEVSWFAAAISGNHDKWTPGSLSAKDWIPAAQLVSRETGVRVDLHTPFFSATIENDSITTVPAFQMEPRVTCGAGDSWNAGDIYGSIHDWSAHDRLTLANAISALYVSSESAAHPTRESIISFLESNPSLSARGSNLLKRL